MTCHRDVVFDSFLFIVDAALLVIRFLKMDRLENTPNLSAPTSKVLTAFFLWSFVAWRCLTRCSNVQNLQRKRLEEEEAGESPAAVCGCVLIAAVRSVREEEPRCTPRHQR